MLECQKCAAWVPDVESKAGECRRHAPLVVGGVATNSMSVVARTIWPRTDKHGGCWDAIEVGTDGLGHPVQP